MKSLIGIGNTHISVHVYDKTEVSYHSDQQYFYFQRSGKGNTYTSDTHNRSSVSWIDGDGPQTGPTFRTWMLDLSSFESEKKDQTWSSTREL